MKIVRYWLPVVLLVSFILTISSLPVEPPSGEVFWPFMVFKKVTHIGEYGLLFLLAYRAFKGTMLLDRSRLFVWSLVLVFLTAVFDEYYQDFVPGGGTSHPHDVIIDLLGALGAYIVVWKLIPKMPTRLRNLAKSLELV